MKSWLFYPTLLPIIVSGPACSLVTVPVKVAGGVAETAVSTAGDVATAPFKAVGGRNSSSPPPQNKDGAAADGENESTPSESR